MEWALFKVHSECYNFNVSTDVYKVRSINYSINLILTLTGAYYLQKVSPI